MPTSLYLDKKRGGVNPPQILEFFQTIRPDGLGNMTNSCNLYKLIDNRQVVCYLYPYHHNDMCNFALLAQQ